MESWRACATGCISAIQAELYSETLNHETELEIETETEGGGRKGANCRVRSLLNTSSCLQTITIKHGPW